MPPEKLRGRIAACLAVAAIVLYYAFFTWRSIGLYFDQDDMMNLYFAWTKPWREILGANVLYWTDPLRPLGALFYRAIFAVAGFNPLPFRLACLAIGLVNLGLCCRFIRLVSGSNQTVAFSAILFAFQTRMMEVWFRTAVIYDLVCFTFFYAAACLYLGTRGRSEHPGVARSIAIVACFIAALDGKEVAVALPAVLVAWELIFAKIRWRNFVVPSTLGLLTIPYILAKTVGEKALTANPYYQPEYTLPRFTESWGNFLGYVFVRPAPLSGMVVFAVLAGMLAVAAIMRERLLLFAWSIIVLGTLPMSFLPYRGGFVLYISYVGWVLYAGVLLSKLVVPVPQRWKLAASAVIFVIAGWRMGKLNLHDQRTDPREWLYGPPRMIQRLAEEVQTTGSGRILLAEDPFGTDEYTPLFILRLLKHDINQVVDRAKMMQSKPPDRNTYQFVFTYENGHYKQLKP